MSTRAALLFDDGDDGHGPLMGALTQVHHLAEVRSSASGGKDKGSKGRGSKGRGGKAWAWWLATYRPDLVISAAQGPDAILAALYRLLAPRTRLVVRLRGAADPRGAGHDGFLSRLLRSMVLARADAVLADDADAAWALPPRWTGMPRRQESVFPLSGPANLEPFLACPLTRPPGSIHRIVFVGPLSPRSGATDILLCVAAWASQQRSHPVEIWWAGEGDLVGILDAQPLPDGMSQRFLGRMDAAERAACFAQCGILVLPANGETGCLPGEASPVVEGLAAGLVVVGSRRNAEVRRLVVDDVTGWTFDPGRFEEFGYALVRALGAVSDDLATMRAEGRRRISHVVAQTDAERLRLALSAVLPAPASTPARHAAGMTILRRQAMGTRLPGAR